MRIAWLMLALSACDPPGARVESSRPPGGAAALEVRLGGALLSVDGALGRDGSDLIVHGRINRPLTAGQAVARDGPDGALLMPTTHTFVVRWPQGELGALVAGKPRLVELDFKATLREPALLSARLIFGLRLEADGVDVPIVRDGDGYRAGHDALGGDELLAHVGGEPLALVRETDDGTVKVLQASVVGSLEKLGLAVGDPRSVWAGMD
jgi:hypothetical protein